MSAPEVEVVEAAGDAVAKQERAPRAAAKRAARAAAVKKQPEVEEPGDGA